MYWLMICTRASVGSRWARLRFKPETCRETHSEKQSEKVMRYKAPSCIVAHSFTSFSLTLTHNQFSLSFHSLPCLISRDIEKYFLCVPAMFECSMRLFTVCCIVDCKELSKSAGAAKEGQEVRRRGRRKTRETKQASTSE